ncbi:MAG: acylphosphatase [Planctomycetota bacterium]
MTTARLAADLRITGYVRNLDDGSVEAVCQCSQSKAELLITHLKGVYGAYIQDTDMQPVSASIRFAGFAVRY